MHIQPALMYRHAVPQERPDGHHGLSRAGRAPRCAGARRRRRARRGFLCARRQASGWRQGARSSRWATGYSHTVMPFTCMLVMMK